MKITPEHIEAFGQAFWHVNARSKIDFHRDEIANALAAVLAAQEQVPVEVAAAPVLFGLEAQGHIPTVERMLAEGKSWQEIGTEIGWFGETANAYYERHKARRATLVASTPPAPVSSETVEVSECAEKIDGMLRKLETLRIAFDMKGANATTILRVVNTLSTMRNTLVAALTAQPLPVQEAVMKGDDLISVPRDLISATCYAIRNKADATNILRKLQALSFAPAPSTAGMVGETPAPDDLSRGLILEELRQHDRCPPNARDEDRRAKTAQLILQKIQSPLSHVEGFVAGYDEGLRQAVREANHQTVDTLRKAKSVLQALSSGALVNSFDRQDALNAISQALAAPATEGSTE